MKINTGIKAGGTRVNHNEKLAVSKSFTIKTGIKAGGGVWFPNHNEKLIQSTLLSSW
jgi:hypothetical protein